PDLLGELLTVEPGALVDTSVSQVDDGDLLTCAAGGHAVDLALHLVERLDSVAACAQVRRRLHFEPTAEPPTHWWGCRCPAPLGGGRPGRAPVTYAVGLAARARGEPGHR